MSIILNWLKEPIVYIQNVDDFNKLKDDILTKYKRTAPTNAARFLKLYKTFSYVASDAYHEIRYVDEQLVPHRVQFSFTGIKNENSGAGHDGYNYINAAFKEEYGEDKSLYTTYSSPKYRDVFKEIKQCVITQVDYYNPKFSGIIDGCYKSDVSSAYPSQLVKSLPDLHNFKRVQGREAPTEEYPFAFYIKSHHLAIYNELDTKQFRKERFYAQCYGGLGFTWKPNDYINAEMDETILCKASPYSLKNVFEKMYDERKSNKNIKLWMVACIGYFHKRGDPFLSHIAAVVLARCAKDMIDRANRLKAEGNTVLLINTDSIIWKGKQSDISAKEKALGAFAIEYENIRVCLKSVKAYQIETPDGKVITKHAGLKKEISATLGFGDIFKIEGDGITRLIIDGEKLQRR